jgi:hypothetical protein
MKKLFFVLAMIPVLSFSQMKINDSVIVPLKNYAGIEINAVYKLVREKTGKKEYELKVYFKNTTGKEIFYKRTGSYAYFANVNSIGSDSCPFSLYGTKATKKIGKNKINIIYPNRLYDANISCVKWYN